MKEETASNTPISDVQTRGPGGWSGGGWGGGGGWGLESRWIYRLGTFLDPFVGRFGLAVRC